MKKVKRELAKVRRCEFMIEEHGFPFLDFDVEYEDGGGAQGLGRIATLPYLCKVMAVFGAHTLKSCVGKSCWVTHDWNKIYKLEPRHKKDGTTFDIEQWAKDGHCCDKCDQWVQNKE